MKKESKLLPCFIGIYSWRLSLVLRAWKEEDLGILSKDERNWFLLKGRL